MTPVSPAFHTEATVSIGRIQSGNIHSIILDVHAVKQSAQVNGIWLINVFMNVHNCLGVLRKTEEGGWMYERVN